MSAIAGFAGLSIREAGPPGAGPRPPEPAAPEDQARFEKLLGQGREPGDRPGPDQPQLEPAVPGRPSSPPASPQGPAGLSGNGILDSLARMSGPAPAGPPPAGALDSPERLVAWQSSLVRGTMALDLAGEARSRAEDGIDQVTK
jgi:hypothetical protein